MIAADEVLIVEPSTAFSNILKQLIFQTFGFHTEVAHDMQSVSSLINRKSGRFFTAIINTHLHGEASREAIDLCVKSSIPTLAFVPNQGVVKNLDLWQAGIADYAFKSGAHSLDHIVWSVNRIFLNRQTCFLVGSSDSPEFVESCARLKHLGFEVAFRQKPDDIIASVHQNKNIELVLLDCTQATFNGISLLNEFRETHNMCDLEIIAVTDDPQLSATLFKSGANDVITLPFVPERLISAVNQSGERLSQTRQIKLLQHDKVHLLSTTAHDIRSPLATINTAASLLLDKQTAPTRIKPLVDMIEKNSSEVLGLIEKMMDLSVLSKGQMNLDIDVIDLGRLVQERVALHHLEAETKQTKIKLENHPKVAVKGDRLKLKQIIDTLLSNAIRSASPHSLIEISTAHSQQSAFFRVIDSGPEIPREDINDLFKSYTPNSDGKNNGRANLNLIKKLVEAHKGKIYYTRNNHGKNIFSAEFPTT